MELKTLGQKVKGLTNGGEDRGVSPVIGVILMVAITVILAAVIGAFVLGLGENLGGSQAPTVSTTMSANSDWDGTDDVAFVMSHSTGDSLTMGDVRIVVRDDSGAAAATFDSSNDFTDTATLVLDGNAGSAIGESDEFSAGSTFKITDGDNTTAPIIGGDEYTIQIIHTPSGSTVSENTITAANN